MAGKLRAVGYWCGVAAFASAVAYDVVQLATVVPAKLHGTAEALRLLEQTPHSLFWD